ncbi:MAG: hypothetical protein FWD55_08930 [Propionibacteriaceae bacterium]|nr:hypothetical protein [Propionibacteriaceae bacterium]
MMKHYERVIRVIFAVIFIGGGIAHFVLGRLQPDSYAGFAQTPVFGWLQDLWVAWVMPNIGWLTIVLGVYELACGVGMIAKRTVPLAVCAMMAFLVFITIVGYGFPTTSLIEDFLKNRAITTVMALLLVPLLVPLVTKVYRHGVPQPSSALPEVGADVTLTTQAAD